ncbi:MAG: 30S ribosomal protein S27ae [Candidatus Nanoarchaeia archaeon]|nr:30S ribosomal protein S27ae [Candidatus Nanoarchaeia archaeon]
MAKKKVKNKKPSKVWTKYKDGKKERSCPRCGPGVFLAKHKDRLYCGSCHYTEFSKK